MTVNQIPDKMHLNQAHSKTGALGTAIAPYVGLIAPSGASIGVARVLRLGGEGEYKTCANLPPVKN